MSKRLNVRRASNKASVQQMDISSTTQSQARRVEATKQGALLRAGKAAATFTSGQEPEEVNGIILAIEMGDLDGAKKLLFDMQGGGFMWSLWSDRAKTVIKNLEAIP